PRMSDGASGFGSQMSKWLGPPCRKSRTTDLTLPQPDLDFVASDAFSAASACNFKTSPSPTPNKPAPPTRINSRRLQPSHVLPGFPGIDNIGVSYRLNKNAGLFIMAHFRSCATSNLDPPSATPTSPHTFS